MKLNELFIGQEYKLTKRFTLADVLNFATLSLDNNPIHLDQSYAEKSIFEKRIVHGFLTGSLFSAIIGTKMPGYGSIYLNQQMNFKKPVFHDEEVTAVVRIKSIKKEKSLIDLETLCYNQKGEIVIEGSALVKLI